MPNQKTAGKVQEKRSLNEKKKEQTEVLHIIDVCKIKSIPSIDGLCECDSEVGV